MPFVTERWPGGMLTNFPTIRKAVKKMSTIDKMEADGTLNHLSKRERLQVSRQRAKLEKNLGSIADLTRLPAALFVVDVMKEYIAVKEANRLGYSCICYGRYKFKHQKVWNLLFQLMTMLLTQCVYHS